MNMYVQLLDILLRKPNKILLYKIFHIVHILTFHLLLAAHAKLLSPSQLITAHHSLPQPTFIGGHQNGGLG